MAISDWRSQISKGRREMDQAETQRTRRLRRRAIENWQLKIENGRFEILGFEISKGNERGEIRGWKSCDKVRDEGSSSPRPSPRWGEERENEVGTK